MNLKTLFVLTLQIVWLSPLCASVASATVDMPVVKPYSFTGKCSSQGLWTRQALETTQSIRTFTTQLRDDANCRALARDMQQSLDQLALLVSPQVGNGVDRLIAQGPQETWTLRSAMADQSMDPDMKAAVTGRLMQTAVNTSAAAAKEYSNGGSFNMNTVIGGSLGGAMGGPGGAAAGAYAANQLSSLGNQFAAASNQGFFIFNRVIDSLPAMNACLTPQGAPGGQLLAASVKMLTAFAASNQDATGSNLSTSISKLSNVLRELHFSGVLRTLNQADFMASMACLVEMSSENYCSTRDSQHLFNEMMRELQLRPRNEEIKRIGAKHVLSGYYVLTQNIPMITDWIQRVQISVRPRLPTDATFQNKIFDEVNEFFKKVKVAQGSFAMELEAMRVVQDEQGRKNAARMIITKLIGIFGDPAYGAGDTLRNFFTLKGSPREIPFLLMGIGIPDEVRGINTAAQTPEQWLELNYMNHPSFNNPEQLVKTVETNLEELLKIAQKNAIEYYNKWFIVDKHSLVNETLLGTNYTVKESFRLVSDYLLETEKRLRANNGELSMIGSIQDTRTRIQNVLNAYEELETLSKSLSPHGNSLTKPERDLIEAANVKIMTAVYDEFEVLLGKSGWFSNRVIKFIYADYLTILRKGEGFGEDLNDLYYATGLAIFDRMVTMGGENPATVQNDLSMALSLSKLNLEAVENLIKDHFAGTLADLKAVAKIGGDQKSVLNRTHTKISTWDRAYKDQLTQLPGETEPQYKRVISGGFQGVVESIKSFFGTFGGIPYLGWMSGANERYAARNERFAMDDEFGSARRLYEQFCIQSLAFSDVRSFYRLCRNSVLRSPFTDVFQTKLTEKQRNDLVVSYDQKLLENREKPELNFSKRVCAFRDYNRKNLVMYLTIGQQK